MKLRDMTPQELDTFLRFAIYDNHESKKLKKIDPNLILTYQLKKQKLLLLIKSLEAAILYAQTH